MFDFGFLIFDVLNLWENSDCKRRMGVTNVADVLK